MVWFVELDLSSRPPCTVRVNSLFGSQEGTKLFKNLPILDVPVLFPTAARVQSFLVILSKSHGLPLGRSTAGDCMGPGLTQA